MHDYCLVEMQECESRRWGEKQFCKSQNRARCDFPDLCPRQFWHRHDSWEYCLWRGMLVERTNFVVKSRISGFSTVFIIEVPTKNLHIWQRWKSSWPMGLFQFQSLLTLGLNSRGVCSSYGDHRYDFYSRSIAIRSETILVPKIHPPLPRTQAPLSVGKLLPWYFHP